MSPSLSIIRGSELNDRCQAQRIPRLERSFSFSFRFKSVLDETIQDPKESQSLDSYKKFLDAGLYFSSLNGCLIFVVISLVVDDKIVLVASRQLLTDLCTTYLTRLPSEQAKEVALYALERIAARAISFEDQVGLYRTFLADIYEREENWREAAKTLCGAPLESAQKYVMDVLVLSLFDIPPSI